MRSLCLALSFMLILPVLACKSSSGADVEPPGEQMKLPKEFINAWSHTRYPRKGHKVPNNWSRVTLEQGKLSFSAGEQSKDSGRRWLKGKFKIKKGEGTKAAPYILKVKVTKKGSSETVGYPKSFQVKDKFKAEVYMESGKLHFRAPDFGSHLLDPPEVVKADKEKG